MLVHQRVSSLSPLKTRSTRASGDAFKVRGRSVPLVSASRKARCATLDLAKAQAAAYHRIPTIWCIYGYNMVYIWYIYIHIWYKFQWRMKPHQFLVGERGWKHIVIWWYTGWWYTHPSEKWWSSSVGIMNFPTEWEKCSKPPTSGIYGNIYIWE